MLPGAMLAAVLVVPPGPTGAIDPTAATAVSWQAPAQCPDAAAVTGGIARLVGRVPEDSEMRVDGRIDAVDGGFALTLRTEAGGVIDERRLVAPRCEALADTAVLIAAVLLDPLASATAVDVPAWVAEPGPSAGDPVGDAPRSGSARAIAPRGVAVTTPAAVAPPSRRLGVWTRLRGGGQYGAVPEFTGGFELALSLGTPRVRGELAGGYWLPRTAGPGGGRIRVQLGAVSPRVCATLPQRRIDVIACGGVELGIMRGDARNGITRQPLWFAATAEAGVRVPLSPRLSLWASLMAVAPVVFPRFQLVDVDDAERTRTVYRPAPAGARALFGLELRVRGIDGARGRSRVR